jgi:BlaI family penicillinase repressor
MLKLSVTKKLPKEFNMIYKITESEQTILNLLWEKEKLTVMQIVKELDEEKKWSKHAVISFLKRMEYKGTVGYEEVGRTKYYYAILAKKDVAKIESKSFLNQFYDGKMGLMVLSMAEENQLKEEDIQDLWDIVQELRKKEEGIL